MGWWLPLFFLPHSDVNIYNINVYIYTHIYIYIYNVHISTHIYHIYIHVHKHIYIHAYKYIIISASSKVSSRPRVLSELEEAHCCTISDCQDMVMERKKKHEDNGDVMCMMAVAWQC